MKTLYLAVGRVAAGVAAVVTVAGPAVAGGPAPPVPVSAPGALTLVSSAVAVGLFAVRWLRRK